MLHKYPPYKENDIRAQVRQKCFDCGRSGKKRLKKKEPDKRKLNRQSLNDIKEADFLLTSSDSDNIIKR